MISPPHPPLHHSPIHLANPNSFASNSYYKRMHIAQLSSTEDDAIVLSAAPIATMSCVCVCMLWESKFSWPENLQLV